MSFFTKLKTFWGRVKLAVKKAFGNKVAQYAIETGLQVWVDIDKERGGKLDRSKYKDALGKWIEGGMAKYEAEKETRRELWKGIVKAAIMAKFPQYSGYTALLDYAIGAVAAIKKANI